MQETNKNYELPKKFACAPADEAIGSPDFLEFNLNTLKSFLDTDMDLFKISTSNLEQKRIEILNWLIELKNCVQEIYWSYCKISKFSRNLFLDGQRTTIMELISDCRNHLEEKNLVQMSIDFECIKQVVAEIIKYIK